MASDPLDAWRKQHRRLERALRDPLERLNRNQRVVERALRDPLEKALRRQTEFADALRPTTEAAAAQQRAVEQALHGPALAIAEQQERIRRALQEPLRRIEAQQAALARAFSAPYAAILANQESLLRLAQAAALATAIDLTDPAAIDDGTEEGRWLSAFIAGIRAASLSVEQLEVLLTHIALLLSFAVTAVGLDDGLGDMAELGGAIATLLSACAVLCYWIRRSP